ncbi:MAG: 50S ribosomal protein L29 [Gammaproteobacteria bacterium]|nr:50S ribosomal protein L29 [Gammaproteobacteria bacterium]
MNNNANELRKQSEDALKKELNSLLREGFNLRMQKATGQLSHSHKIGEVKRNIARIKTVLNEKAKGGAQ